MKNMILSFVGRKFHRMWLPMDLASSSSSQVERRRDQDSKPFTRLKRVGNNDYQILNLSSIEMFRCGDFVESADSLHRHCQRIGEPMHLPLKLIAKLKLCYTNCTQRPLPTKYDHWLVWNIAIHSHAAILISRVLQL